jgi:hypothetical protein
MLALSSGILLKFGLSVYGIQSSDSNLVAYAQPNITQPAHANKRETPTPSSIQQSQYLPDTQSQSSKGIKITASNFYVENNQVFVDVCYDLPGKDIWDINMAMLEYNGGSTGNFAVNETSIDVAQGFRCLRLNFYDIATNADLSKLTLTIGNLGQIPPAEGHECEGYLARINSNEKVKNSGITVVCEQSPSGAQVKLEHKPDNINEEDANQLISEAMFNQVLGNWVFTVEKNK